MKKNGHAPIPNVAAIHDLAAWGRCSLSVVMPTLSAMGYQVTPLPTALLSTHTGDFFGFSFLDLTEEMDRMAAHWEKEQIPFRAIYSGFLGSVRQIDSVLHFIDTFRRDDTVILIDPVLGDDGIFYQTCTEELCRGMRRLAAKADILCPNLTEAHLLSGIPYRDVSAMTPAERDAYFDLLFSRLHALGSPKVVITGYEEGEGEPKIGVILSDRGMRASFVTEKIAKSYPGTGELFASLLLGKLLDGKSLEDAAAFAAVTVADIIRDSAKEDYPTREGVLLERNLFRVIPQEKYEKFTISH